MLDPLDNVIEYTTVLEIIEDEETWEPRTWDPMLGETQDQWGTGGSMTEVLLSIMLEQLDDSGLAVFPEVPVCAL